MKPLLSIPAGVTLLLAVSLACADDAVDAPPGSFAPRSLGVVALDAPAPEPPKRSRGAYAAGIAMASVGGTAFSVGLGALLLDGLFQSSSWTSCRGPSYSAGACRDQAQLLSVAAAGMLAGAPLFAGGIALGVWGKKPVGKTTPTTAELRPAPFGAQLVVGF